jgi:hypothetical protein
MEKSSFDRGQHDGVHWFRPMVSSRALPVVACECVLVLIFAAVWFILHRCHHRRMFIPELTKRIPESLSDPRHVSGRISHAGSADTPSINPIYGVAVRAIHQCGGCSSRGILPGVMLITCSAGYAAVRAWMNPQSLVLQ